MNSPFKRVFRLAHKELREILRDRRTIITLVAMPLLLYPLMSVAFQQFYLASRIAADPGTEYGIGVLSNEEVALFNRRFTEGQNALKEPGEKAGESKKPARKLPNIKYFQPEHLPANDAQREDALEKMKDMLRQGAIDLILVIPDRQGVDRKHFPPEHDWLGQCEFYAMPNSGAALAALDYIGAAFAAINEKNLKERLNLEDAKPRINFLTMKRLFLESTGPEKAVPLSALVPLILILMTITGAVYPAIDLTAGERERGTLEILVAAPVPRFELLTAKYISVFTVAILTALVNLVCMTVTISWSGLGQLLFKAGMSPVLLIDLLGLLLLFAAFFSAVLLCLTSFARSFKEAQAYLIPLMMASLAPGIMGMLPGLELNPTLAALPLVNIVLMARDLFGDGVDPALASIVVLTTIFYALAALALAARIFGAESVLYSEQSSWADLLRRPAQKQPSASIPAMLWCLALMVPIHFAAVAFLRMLIPMKPDVEPTSSQVVFVVLFMMALSVLLFAGLPGLFAYLGRVDLWLGVGIRVRDRDTLLLGLAAGLALGASLWPLQLWLLSQSDIHNATRERFASVLQSFRQIHDVIGWGVLATVIVPALLEEFFFRGLLFQALRRRTGAWTTIGASAALFALTHVVLGGALGLERLMPSFLLGLILSTVCWFSDSLWPSMVLHVCHNTILGIVGMGALGPNDDVPWEWRLAGAIGTAIGVGLLILLVFRHRSQSANSANTHAA